MIDPRQIGGLGPIPVVLHGQFCKRTKAGVPHQRFSDVAIPNGFYDGLLGLKVDVPGKTVDLAPAPPANWQKLKVERIPIGTDTIDIALRQDAVVWHLMTTSKPTVEFDLHLRPKLPLAVKSRPSPIMIVPLNSN